jgi:hypothetical protein
MQADFENSSESDRKKAPSPPAGESPMLTALREVIGAYLQANPKMSLNSLSKRCSVSEPTLRRIMKGEVKFLASVTTVVDILMYVSKEESIPAIVRSYPGPIADYLRQNLGPACDEQSGIDYAPALNDALKDPMKYLIYKRAANTSGVHMDEVESMFGYAGRICIEDLIAEGWLSVDKDIYRATVDNFALSHDHFVKCFKATSDFIKPQKLGQAKYNNMFLNYSRSLNSSAYKELIKAQQTAIRKCIHILNDPKSEGKIPAFLLIAIDTLSAQSAAEIAGD